MSGTKILFEGGRVQLETESGDAIWLDEGEALLVAHALTERLTIPTRFEHRKGFGPGDGGAGFPEGVKWS